MTNDMMVVYLEKVFLLEKLAFEETYLCNRLKKEIAKLKHQNNSEINMRSHRSESDAGIASLAVGVGIVGSVVSIAVLFIVSIFGDYTSSVGFFETIFNFALCGFVIGGLIGGAIGMADLNSIQKDNREVDEYNKKLRNEHAYLKRKNDEQIKIMQEEIRIVQGEMNNTQKLLSTYYSKNIIYPKYRDLVPISSIYEYFKSGRCCCLEGHEGAYNIYENELRLNLIITKLDDIIYNLEQIKSSQYMLYDAISSVKNDVSSISNTMMRLEENVRSIYADTQIVKYNNMITAKNTEFLKWIEVLK